MIDDLAKSQKIQLASCGFDLASAYFHLLPAPVLTGAGTAGMTEIKLVATFSLLIKKQARRAHPVIKLSLKKSWTRVFH